ncbi:MAG: hypothetical protein LBC18_09930 [Opitutaceae bacterium]|nr:hypothetical protein [Opitutaceae bacterium]
MSQQFFHAGDTLPRGPDMPPLAAIHAAFARKAIIRLERHDACSKQAAADFTGSGLQNRPADGVVPDIE